MSQKLRAGVIVLLLLGAAALVSLDAAFGWLRGIMRLLENLIATHVVLGAILFFVFSALSAMLAFFSTALLVPVAIGVWGKVLTALLLWAGWLCGGVASYAIGSRLGRRVVRWFIREENLQRYEQWLSRNLSFRHVLLFQLALPSEVPGYVLGLARYRFRTYAAALVIAELPFAIGSVYLGESFLQRNVPMMILIGAGGLVLVLIAGGIYARLNRAAPLRTSPQHL